MKRTTPTKDMRWLVLAPMAAASMLYAGCAGDDVTFFIGRACSVTAECTYTANPYMMSGLLDVGEAPVGQVNRQEYVAGLMLQTNNKEATLTAQPGSFNNYGDINHLDIIVEEMEISYEFPAAEVPSDAETQDALPRAFVQPVFGWVGPRTAAAGGEAGSSTIEAVLVPETVAQALRRDSTVSELIAFRGGIQSWYK